MLSLPGLEIYPSRRKVFRDRQEIQLTASESNTIGFHICNLREKLYQAAPNTPFTIRSVREVGYCFEIQAEK